jgi:hypothetical protein
VYSEQERLCSEQERLYSVQRGCTVYSEQARLES